MQLNTFDTGSIYLISCAYDGSIFFSRNQTVEALADTPLLLISCVHTSNEIVSSAILGCAQK